MRGLNWAHIELDLEIIPLTTPDFSFAGPFRTQIGYTYTHYPRPAANNGAILKIMLGLPFIFLHSKEFLLPERNSFFE